MKQDGGSVVKSTKVPWAWQLQAKALAVRKYFAIIAGCGCGKSLAGILIALAKNKPTIVIAPTHRLCEQWKNEIQETDSEADVWVYSKPEATRQGKSYEERFETWLMQ